MKRNKIVLLGAFILVVMISFFGISKVVTGTGRDNLTPVTDEQGRACTINLGKLKGKVKYNADKDYYLLTVRGAKLPFKSSPIEAQDVLLEAPGNNDLEKNTSLLYSMLGKQVTHITILINPDEEDEVSPALNDIARYIQIANRKKYAGFAYTKEGGKQNKSLRTGNRIQSLESASCKTPIVQIKGPESGAVATRVSIEPDGKIIVEGTTYKDLYKAADYICITLLKMLCGSPECPDAGACASGGSCGCG